MLLFCDHPDAKSAAKAREPNFNFAHTPPLLQFASKELCNKLIEAGTKEMKPARVGISAYPKVNTEVTADHQFASLQQLLKLF